VFHVHLRVMARYADDAVLLGSVWGMPSWWPSAGGDAKRGHFADTLPRALA
jgi:diadenosine tetraphosphate (Ap4A) HIT family hydrolase